MEPECDEHFKKLIFMKYFVNYFLKISKFYFKIFLYVKIYFFLNTLEIFEDQKGEASVYFHFRAHFWHNHINQVSDDGNYGLQIV